MPDRGPDKTEWPRFFTFARHAGSDDEGLHEYYVGLHLFEVSELLDGWQHRILTMRCIPDGDFGISYHMKLTGNEARELDDKLQQMRGYIPARRVQQDRIREFNDGD